MSERAPYSRVYWSIVDDPKFAQIYDNDRHLATWLRLLIIAEGAHPSSALIPTGTSRSSLMALVEAGLIDLGTGRRYRVHGLVAERSKRTDEQRNGGQVRMQNARRGPDGRLLPNTSGGPAVVTSGGYQRDQLRRDELSKDETSNARDGEPHITAWLMVKHRLPTVAQQAFLDRYLQVFDVTGPERMAQIILANPDPIAALKADLDKHREERLGELGRTPLPTPRFKSKREPWQDEFKALLDAKEAALVGTPTARLEEGAR